MHTVRVILYLFLICFRIPDVYSQCPAGRIVIAPAGDSMDNHSLIIIRAWGDARKYLEAIVTGKKPAYLQSGFMRVPLMPLQYHRGAYLTSEIVLKPGFHPQTGIRYTLHADLPSYAGSDSPAWSIVPGPLHVPPPVLSGQPRLLRTGGEVICRVEASGKGALFASIIIQDTRYLGLHKRYKKFLLPLKQGTGVLSGGNCGSAFAIRASGNYLASVTVMDLDGNSSGEKNLTLHASIAKTP